MINTKNELSYYLKCDKVALGKTASKPSRFGDEIWKFQICMRKLDYYSKTNGILKWYYRYQYHRMSIKLGFSIPYNIIGPGLAIVHYGMIVISSDARIGCNCRIHSGVNIGANAVVTKDVPACVTVGGIPAKIISENNSSKHLTRATELVNNGGKNNESSV
ncbi:MAG: hypothetical protein ACI4CT_03010 [Lachnospiraceae bacterium]